MTTYTLALPSKGELAEPTDLFFKAAGLRVTRPNPRQYTGHLTAVPELSILFQRVRDVVYKVADGTAQLGIAGLDVVREYGDDSVVVIHPALDYGHCQLVVAVPEAWIDVHSIADLQEVALDIRRTQRRNLRIATTFPSLTQAFLQQHNVQYFSLVRAEGAIEAAPTIGYADAVVDLTQSGTTLRENHLRMLPDGIILESQACLIGNRAALVRAPALLEIVRQLLDYFDATLNGDQHCQISADIVGRSPEEVAALVHAHPSTRGLLGPTIAPIYSSHGPERWYTIQITVPHRNLLPAVDYLRSVGAAHVIIAPVRYLFMNGSARYHALRSELGL